MPLNNYVRQNQDGPGFAFPKLTTTITPSAVVTNVKNVVKSFLDNSTSTTQPSITLQETTNSSITSEIVQSQTATPILSETTNSTRITDIAQNTNLTEMISSASNETDFGASTEGGNIFFTSPSTTLSTITDLVTNEHLDGQKPHVHDNIEDKTMYIIIGIILAAFVVISIIITIVYRRYRRENNVGSRTGVYCVNDLGSVRVTLPNGTQSPDY